MPITFVRKLAKRHGTSVKKSEEKWNKAKKIAKKQGFHGNYGYITKIYKNLMHEHSSANRKGTLEWHRKHYFSAIKAHDKKNILKHYHAIRKFAENHASFKPIKLVETSNDRDHHITMLRHHEDLARKHGAEAKFHSTLFREINKLRKKSKQLPQTMKTLAIDHINNYKHHRTQRIRHLNEAHIHENKLIELYKKKFDRM